jgi:hypothetical protein
MISGRPLEIKAGDPRQLFLLLSLRQAIVWRSNVLIRFGVERIGPLVIVASTQSDQQA